MITAERPIVGDGSRINQRQCSHCAEWYWAWNSTSSLCRVCQPKPTAEDREMLAAIQAGQVGL